MIKTRKIKVKSIENEKIIMAMTMTKTMITKSVQVKAIHIYLKGRNVQKAMFY